jgi:phospholipid/cholesterol/gamma-HCH transport system substrate-binding protein
MPKLNNMMSNVESITLNLRNNNDRINLILANLKSSSDQLAAAKIKSTIDNANTTLEQMGMIMTKINNGEGSIGLLVNDKSLYNQLNNSATDLDKLIKDLNNNPAKYIPIPFTKGQRKKAIEKSEQH